LGEHGYTDAFRTSSSGDSEGVTIFGNDRSPDLLASDFVEIRRTTDLEGQAGTLRKTRYWLQALLGGSGSVVVGCTGRQKNLSLQRVRNDNILRFQTSELCPNEAESLHNAVERVLRFLLSHCTEGEPLHIRLRKNKGTETLLHLRIERAGVDRRSLERFGAFRPFACLDHSESQKDLIRDRRRRSWP